MNAEKLSVQMIAAVLSIKSKSTQKHCDSAVCSALQIGQKVEIFRLPPPHTPTSPSHLLQEKEEKKRQSMEFQDEPGKTNASQNLEMPHRRNPCIVYPGSKAHWSLLWAKAKWTANWCSHRCLLSPQTTHLVCLVHNLSQSYWKVSEL